MTRRALPILIALLMLASPAQAEDCTDCEPEEPEDSGEPQDPGPSVNNQTLDDPWTYTMLNNYQPPPLYRELMAIINGDAPDCSVYYFDPSDVESTRVDPDSCWVP